MMQHTMCMCAVCSHKAHTLNQSESEIYIIRAKILDMTLLSPSITINKEPFLLVPIFSGSKNNKFKQIVSLIPELYNSQFLQFGKFSDLKARITFI